MTRSSIPLSARWWLLPRFRDVDREPLQERRSEDVDRLMRERPLSHSEAVAEWQRLNEEAA